MNQSGKKKRKLTIPGSFDISVSMEKAINKVEDEYRMTLGTTSAINQEERKLLAALAKENKEKGAETEAEVK